MAEVGIVGLVSIGLGTIGLLASVLAVLRAPAERRMPARSLLVGVAGLTLTAVLVVVLPPISLRTPVLWTLVALGAIAGLVAGSAVRIRRHSQGLRLAGGTWHLLPAAVALLALQLAGVAEWRDGVVIAAGAIVASTAFAVGAVVLVVVRGAAKRRQDTPSELVAAHAGSGTATPPYPGPTAANAAPPVGTTALVEPTGGPTPPRARHRWSRNPAARAALILGGAALLVSVGWLLGNQRTDSRSPSSASTSAATDGAPTPTAAVPSATGRVPDPSEAAAPSSPAPGPGSRYIGLTFPSDESPPGVSELSGALLADTVHATSWMTGPEGDMFWLLREAQTEADGSVAAWEVLDVVLWPPVTEDSAEVVSGAVPCELDGASVTDVAAIFPLVDAEWFTDPYAAWWADTRIGELVPLPARTRCLNEAYGV